MIRKAIRKLILENASLAEASVIDILKKDDLVIVVEMSPPWEGAVKLTPRGNWDEEYGEMIDPINVRGTFESEPTPNFPDTMSISSTNLDHSYRKRGVGRLLYHVLLAVCTDENIWLMADREDVSGMAQRIWHRWAKHPELYEIEQMDIDPPYDNEEGDYFLTPEEDDDVVQGSFLNDEWKGGANPPSNLPEEAYDESGLEKDVWFYWDEEFKETYLKSGLTKRYMMKGSTEFLEALENEEILYYSQPF